jgi:hypothetical protein
MSCVSNLLSQSTRKFDGQAFTKSTDSGAFYKFKSYTVKGDFFDSDLSCIKHL